MAFAGIRGTGSWGTDERPTNFREGILWKQPNGNAPLYALTAKVKKETTNDPQISWWEETLSVPRPIMDATGASATSTAFGLVSGGLDLVPGDLLLVEKTEVAAYDNEIVMVSSVTSDTAIVVKRAQAGTTGAATGVSAPLTRIGNAMEEAGNSPSQSSRNPTKVSNFCQIFKTKVGISESAEATHARTGDPFKNDKKRKAFDHSASLEFSFFWGKKAETTGPGGFPLRFMDGVRTRLSTNVKVYTTTPTESDFLDTTYPMFNYNVNSGAGSERIVFCGNGFLNSLNKLAKNSTSTRINFDGTLKLYGMELQKWQLPQGTFAIKSHPLFNVHPRFNYSAFFLDFSNFIYTPLKGRDTKFEDHIEANDADAHLGQWLSEVTLETHHENTMGYLGNFVVP